MSKEIFVAFATQKGGISYPCEKTHYILVDFRLRDSILLIGMLALFAVVIWTSFQPISF